MAQYDIFLLDKNKQALAQVERYSRAEIFQRFNGVGSWSIEIDSEVFDLGLIEWQGGIRVLRNGDAFFEGLTLMVEDANADEPDSRIVLAGSDYMHYLAQRVVLPDPNGPPYSSFEYDVRTGPADDVIKAYVNYHVGPLAKAARIVSGITVAPPLGQASTVTGRGRFQTVLELCQDMALEGGDIGFRFRGAELETFLPEDLSASVYFSRDRGTLMRYKRRVEMPQANYILGGGSGEGTARNMQETGMQGSMNIYGRNEWFYDYRSAEDAELYSSVVGKLDEMAEKVSVEIEAGSTEGQQFERDYHLGDIVSVIIPELTYQQVIREVRITLDASGEKVYPMVGSPGSRSRGELGAIAGIYDSQRQTIKRVSSRERV